MRRSSQLLLFVTCIAVSHIASAATIYNNIDSGAGFTPAGYTTSNTYFATTFTATGAGNLSSVELVIGAVFSFPVPLTGGLYTNSGGQPGSLLESWDFSAPVTDIFNPTPTVLTSILHPSLTTGIPYWFVLTQNVITDRMYWTANNTGITGGMWSGASINGLYQAFGDQRAPAIQLTSTAPEPGTFTFVGAGLLSVWLRSKRRLL